MRCSVCYRRGCDRLTCADEAQARGIPRLRDEPPWRGAWRGLRVEPEVIERMRAEEQDRYAREVFRMVDRATGLPPLERALIIIGVTAAVVGVELQNARGLRSVPRRPPL